MDGLEASAKIIELNTKVPIVAMTANIMSSDKEIYKANGMHDCLGKPFTSQELWRCLMKYLKPVSRETMNASIRHKKGPLGLGDPGKSDSEFQRELQQLFYKSNIEKFDEITKALNEDNITLARRLTHTLKGNAGQLGKDKLQQAAANIEHRLKDGKNLVTPEQMTVLETELNAVLEELGAPVPTTQTEPNGKFLDTKSALELMEKLEPMLKMGNAEGRKFIVNIRRIPDNNSLKTEGLKNLLIEQIEDFDFDEALVSLSELKKAFGTVIRE
jgi:HPt (histidine-containing phosphotransfer) domain-containing protein